MLISYELNSFIQSLFPYYKKTHYIQILTQQKYITYGGVIKRPMRPENDYPFVTKIVISHKT